MRELFGISHFLVAQDKEVMVPECSLQCVREDLRAWLSDGTRKFSGVYAPHSKSQPVSVTAQPDIPEALFRIGSRAR
jgi:endogenous inhibitor of DNA gyrase (YacG/DUF329 family)